MLLVLRVNMDILLYNHQHVQLVSLDEHDLDNYKGNRSFFSSENDTNLFDYVTLVVQDLFYQGLEVPDDHKLVDCIQIIFVDFDHWLMK